MQKFNLKKIKRVLAAASETAYYQQLFSRNGIDIETINSYEDFRKIPITTKEEYRNNTMDFLRESIRKTLDEELFGSEYNNYVKCDEILFNAGLNMSVTSGSTGLPLKVIHSQLDDNRNYFILNLYRKKYANLSFEDNYVWILPMNEKTKQYFYDEKTSYLEKPHGIEFFLASFTNEKMIELHNTILRYNIRWLTGAPTVISEYGLSLIHI